MAKKTTPRANSSTTSPRRGTKRGRWVLTGIAVICVVLIALFIVGWLPGPWGVGTLFLSGSPERLVLRHGNEVWLFQPGHLGHMTAPGGKRVSISPNGRLLLVDGRGFVDVQTGHSAGAIQAVIPVSQLDQSLWLSSQSVILGSESASGLYLVDLRMSSRGQMASANCTLGSYSAGAVDRETGALLCVAGNGLGVVRIHPALSYADIHFQPPAATPGQYVSFPSWVPHSKQQQITFVWATAPGPTTGPTRSQILEMSASGGKPTVLVSEHEWTFATLPVWSPDGKSLAYVEEHPGSTPSSSRFAVHVLTPSTHKDRVIGTGSGPGPATMAWSASGKYLAFDGDSSLLWGDVVTVVELASNQHTAVASGAQLVGWAGSA